MLFDFSIELIWCGNSVLGVWFNRAITPDLHCHINTEQKGKKWANVCVKWFPFDYVLNYIFILYWGNFRKCNTHKCYTIVVVTLWLWPIIVTVRASDPHIENRFKSNELTWTQRTSVNVIECECKLKKFSLWCCECINSSRFLNVSNFIFSLSLHT